MLCALLPRAKAPFRLPRSAFSDVHSKPRPYSHIPCLKYLCKVPPKEPGPECQCQQGQCDERCLNRILHIEYVHGLSVRPSLPPCWTDASSSSS